MAELHDIILRPIVTEKTARSEAANNVYTFQVGTSANKLEIKDAVERLFGVTVESVRTINVRGKVRRHGRHHGRRSDWKKAYVKLSAGNALSFFEG
jgi:large subunit ribosomal protein L23